MHAHRLMRELTRMLAPALTAVALGCREDAESPTAPNAGPAFAQAAAALAFRQVSAGVSHTCGVTTDDRAYCWGYNFAGQLGNGESGSDAQSSRPVAVSGTLRFRSVSAGAFFTCGLTTGDLAYCWGYNNSGVLGDGTTIQRVRPVAVAGGRKFRQISAGSDHACALNFYDRLFCWGNNGSGALGDGTTTNRLTPTRVRPTSLLFRQVSAGEAYTCGVTPGNRAYCWGKNTNGQLGDRSKTGRLNPVAVYGGLSFRQVSTLWRHTCGVTTGNQAYCWGHNGLRQLGDGSDWPRRLKPVPVLGGLQFSRVSVGYGDTCGVLVNDRAYCWGSNGSGELGDGTRDSHPTPVAVVGGHEFRQFDTGADHNCGTTFADVAYCWGDDFFGELGDGRSGVGVLSTRPVAVVAP